ncbi:hypothetical protein IKT18_01075 [Candidatus Saccharibacteria bacterium]|nr:hypothetical protein [Candidatus Saccharibacteria bacterium]
MKKILYSLIIGIVGLVGLLTPISAAPAYADGDSGSTSSGDNDCYEGAILHVCDDGEGSGVMQVLNIVVNIFTVAIGILAAVGIAITGTQYLTAGPNEEKTRKAKRRLVEIVIGVAAYVLIYSLLVWLLPGFNGFGG